MAKYLDKTGTQRLVDNMKDYANNKVAKTTTASRVYATDSSGNQTSLPYGNSNNPYDEPNFIVRRDNDGQIYTRTNPTDSKHCASKNYVDNITNPLISAVSTIFNSKLWIADCNQTPTTANNGIYFYNTSTANRPNIAGWGVVLQFTPSNDISGAKYAVQIAFGNYYSNGWWAFRMWNPDNTGWANWEIRS